MSTSVSPEIEKILEMKSRMLQNSQRHYSRWQDNKERHLITKKLEAQKKALGLSNLRIPFEFAYVEAKSSSEMETLPFMQAVPTEPEDNEYANQIQKIIDYVSNNVLNLKSTFYKMHVAKNVYGDAFLKIYWHTDKRKVKCPIVKYEGKGRDKKRYLDFEEKTITYYDDIKIDLLDPRQVLIDPICFQAGKTIEDANYVGFIYVYELDFVKKTFKSEYGYKNINDLQPSTTDTDSAAPSKEEQNSKLTSNMVEIYEHWDLLNDKVTFIANGEVVIKESPIPYYNPITGVKMLPIAHFCGHYLGDGFFNFGEVDLVKALADERQGQRNINLDVGKTMTMPFMVKPTEMDLETDGFRLGANMIMEMEDPSALKVIQMSANSNLPFALERANQEDAIMATGHDITAIISGKAETATKTLERKESEVARTRYTTAFNEMNGYRRTFTLIKNLVLQFYGESMEKILGEKPVFRTIFDKEYGAMSLEKNPVLDRDYDILIATNNQLPAAREIDKLRLQELIGILGSLPFNPQTGELPAHLVPPVKQLFGDMKVNTADYPQLFQPKQEMPQEEQIPAGLQDALGGLQEQGIDVGDPQDFMTPPAPDDFDKMFADAENFIKPKDGQKGMSQGIQPEIQSYIQGASATK